VSYNDKLCKFFNKIIWNRIKVKTRSSKKRSGERESRVICVIFLK